MEYLEYQYLPMDFCGRIGEFYINDIVRADNVKLAMYSILFT